MVAEAEKYKSQDEEVASRIAAKNGLESYSYNLRNTLNDEKVAGKLDASDKASVEKIVNETIQWLDHNQEANKEEYESRQKELESKVNPIMMKLYGQGGAGMPNMPGGAPGGFPGGAAPGGESDAGPTIEEVD